MRLYIDGPFMYVETINLNGSEYVKLDEVKRIAESVWFSALAHTANSIKLRVDTANQSICYELKENKENV